MKKRIVLLPLLLCLIAASPAFAQQAVPKGKSSKYRTILTIAGAGGGFVLGVFAGIGAFDDSINSSRKVWTTAIITGAAGGVGGYFLGRSLDKRGSKTTWAPRPTRDEWDGLRRALSDQQAEGYFRYKLPDLQQLRARSAADEDPGSGFRQPR